MNYKENDNELVYLVGEDSDHYRYILFTKYKNIIYKIGNDYYQKYGGLNLDYDDLIQEGMIGFNRAIDTYNSNCSLFYTYAIICIKRAYITYIRNCYSKKNIINSYKIEDSSYYNNLVYDDDIFISSLYEYEFCKLKNSLSFDESIIFELKYNGFSYYEISKLLDMKISTITKNMCKIRLNLKKTNELYL